MMRWRVDSCAPATANAEVNNSPTSTMAATAKAVNAAANPPTVKAYPARPARIGPVHPKPART